MRRRTFLRASALSGLSLTFRPALALPDRVTREVPTNAGPIRGYSEDGVHRFLGVPYAEPPIGALRFAAPDPVKPRKGLYEAIYLRHSAMQLPSGGGAARYPGTVGPALSQLFGSGRDRIWESEDCLYLNVWTPGLDDKARPVMVWFHGGGHNYGSGSWPAYDGHNLARAHDVVVVTVNHRLNVFGHLAAGDEPGIAVNAGELDLVASLEWVRDNIAEFGGNPGNVTIFGQSGGGSKVAHCLVMPRARGLVHRAIIQSGGGLTTGAMDQALEQADRIARALGCTPKDIGKLRAIPAPELLAAAMKLSRGYGPCADGTIVPRAPFTPLAPEQSRDVPIIIGYTKDERTLYNIGLDWWGTLTDAQLSARAEEIHGEKGPAILAAYRRIHPHYSNDYLFTDLTNSHAWRAPAKAERKIDLGGAPVWLYQWDWEAPVDGGILKSPHTMEIPFVFNNVDKGPLLLGKEPTTFELAALASASWAAFARTGDPNVDGLPDWPAYDRETRATMLFDLESRIANDPLGEVRKLFATED
jgi:para-nitrobenzyl esterase